MKIMEYIKKMFSLDYRSLALMRISIGLVLVLDVIERGRSLVAHYTDLGVLPRSHFLELFNNSWLISVHNMSGSAMFEGIIFLVTAFFAVSVLIGYRTTLATALSWFLVISVQNRNPLIIQGGDVILRCVLFWAMFIPWGARWSFDNFRNKTKPAEEKLVFSPATFAYVIQIFLFYFFSGILKTGMQWKDGSALYYTLNIDQFTSVIGHFLLSFPRALTFLTHATIILEIYGAVLFIFPFWNQYTRLFAILSFALFQIGINVSMNIGLFGAISIAVTLGLLPSIFWDKFLPYFKLSRRKGLTIYFDGDCGFCKRTVQYIKRLLFLSNDTKIIQAQEVAEMQEAMRRENSWVVVDETRPNGSSGREGRQFYGFDGLITALRFSPVWWPLVFVFKLPGIHHIGEYFYRRVADGRLTICLPPKKVVFNLTKERRQKVLGIIKNVVVTALLLFIVFWNIDTLPNPKKIIPDSLKPIAWTTRLDQKFDMFAPYPMIDDGWYIIPGTLRDGTLVDVYKNGGPVNYGKPQLVSHTYPDQRWQKYMMNLWRNDYSKYRLYYGQYLCRQWNDSHTEDDKKLDNFRIIYMREDTLPDYKNPTIKPTTIWEHYCFK